MADRMIAWLEQQSPDVWHVIAQNINWGFGTNVLRWIVGHPQCDRATAQQLLLVNDGGWDMEGAAGADSYKFDQEPADSNDAGIFGTIVQRWNAGNYVRSEIRSYDGFEGDAKRFLAQKSNDPDCYWAIVETIGDRIEGKPALSLSNQLVSFELRVLFTEKGSFFSFDDENQESDFTVWCIENGFESAIRWSWQK